jgi:hypothetical protein
MGSSSATRQSWLLQSPIQIEETPERVVATLRPMRLPSIARPVNALITTKPLWRRATTHERTIADSAGRSAAELVAKL